MDRTAGAYTNLNKLPLGSRSFSATISTPSCSGSWWLLGSSPNSSASSPTGKLSR